RLRSSGREGDVGDATTHVRGSDAAPGERLQVLRAERARSGGDGRGRRGRGSGSGRSGGFRGRGDVRSRPAGGRGDRGEETQDANAVEVHRFLRGGGAAVSEVRAAFTIGT